MSPDTAARSGALFVARPDLGTVEVTGDDRLTWLQGIVTADVAALGPGSARWGLVLTKPGKILSDVVALAAGDAALLATPPGQPAALVEWFGRYLVMEDADVRDASTERAWAMLHGPRASEAASALAARFAGAWGAVDFTGLGGAILAVPRSLEGELAPAAAALDGVVVASPGDWERLRVERLVPLYGVDMGAEQNPHEASLDRRAVSWDKGCYLGQEAVCMQDMRGKVKRRLVVAVLEGDELPPPGTPVLDAAGTATGQTRTAARSALLGGAAVIALVSADHAAAGTRLSVLGRSARVVDPTAVRGPV